MLALNHNLRRAPTTIGGAKEGTMKREPQGPRRREWERLYEERRRIAVEIHQLLIDLHSYNDNRSAGTPALKLGRMPHLPKLRPMPAWDE